MDVSILPLTRCGTLCENVNSPPLYYNLYILVLIIRIIIKALSWCGLWCTHSEYGTLGLTSPITLAIVISFVPALFLTLVCLDWHRSHACIEDIVARFKLVSIGYNWGSIAAHRICYYIINSLVKVIIIIDVLKREPVTLEACKGFHALWVVVTIFHVKDKSHRAVVYEVTGRFDVLNWSFWRYI